MSILKRPVRVFQGYLLQDRSSTGSGISSTRNGQTTVQVGVDVRTGPSQRERNGGQPREGPPAAEWLRAHVLRRILHPAHDLFLVSVRSDRDRSPFFGGRPEHAGR
jgi:hypothetical protein